MKRVLSCATLSISVSLIYGTLHATTIERDNMHGVVDS